MKKLYTNVWIVDDMLAVTASGSRIPGLSDAELHRVRLMQASSPCSFYDDTYVVRNIGGFLIPHKYSPERIQWTVILMILRTSARHPDNPRNVSCFNRNDHNWNWLDNNFNSNYLVVRR